MNTKLALFVIPVLAACSGTGSSLGPMKASATNYQNWSCHKLADEQMRLGIAIKAVSPEIQSASNFARSKVVQADRQREYEAVTKIMHSKKCSMPKQIVAWVS
jgi:hypothetical protein